MFVSQKFSFLLGITRGVGNISCELASLFKFFKAVLNFSLVFCLRATISPAFSTRRSTESRRTVHYSSVPWEK